MIYMIRFILMFCCLLLIASISEAVTLYAMGNGVGDASSNLYRIDNYATTPTSVNIGEAHVRLLDIAIDPVTNRYYGVNGTALFELNPITGAASLVGNLGASSQNALEFDSNGQLFTWGYMDSNLYRVNKATGASTLIGNTDFFSGGDLAFDTDGMLYGTTSDQLVRINPATGTAALVGSLGFTGAFGLDFDESGILYAGQGNDSTGLAKLYTVNKMTAAATLIGNVAGAGSFGLYGLTFVPFPQPVSWKGGDTTGPTNWDIAANWNPNTSVPDGTGIKVTFGDQSSVNFLVDMTSNGRTVGSIAFAAMTSTTIQSTGGLSLTLNNNGSTSPIIVEGNHSITAPMILNNDASIAGSGSLNLAGGVTGGHTLTVLGNLMASSIQVNTLIIGSTGTAAVPEPSMVLLLGMGLTGLIVLWRRKIVCVKRQPRLPG